MMTRTHFAFRIDLWDATADNIVEHVAGAEDFQIALADAAAVASCEASRGYPRSNRVG
jgi:hypothetical protein